MKFVTLYSDFFTPKQNSKSDPEMNKRRPEVIKGYSIHTSTH